LYVEINERSIRLERSRQLSQSAPQKPLINHLGPPSAGVEQIQIKQDAEDVVSLIGEEEEEGVLDDS